MASLLSSSSLSAYKPFNLLDQLHYNLHYNPQLRNQYPSSALRARPLLLQPRPLPLRARPLPPLSAALSSGGGNDTTDGNNGGGGGDGDDGGWSDGNRGASMFALAQAGRKLESLPSDLAAAIVNGRVPAEIVRRFLEMEASPLLQSLLQLQWCRDRVLADELFLTKLTIECLVGVIAKIAVEYERRKGNFFKEIDIVYHAVVTRIATDVMLVCISTPTVSLQTSLGTNGWLYIISHAIFVGRSYILAQATKYCCGKVGRGVINALIKAGSAVGKELDDKVVDIPAVSTPRKVKENDLAADLGVDGEIPGGPSVRSFLRFLVRSRKNEIA